MGEIRVRGKGYGSDCIYYGTTDKVNVGIYRSLRTRGVDGGLRLGD